MSDSIWVFIFSRSGSKILRRIGLPWSGRHAIKRLPHDAHTLAHLFHANLKTRVDVIGGSGRNFEIELLVAGVRAIFARICLDPGGTQHRAGDAEIEHQCRREIARRPWCG